MKIYKLLAVLSLFLVSQCVKGQTELRSSYTITFEDNEWRFVAWEFANSIRLSVLLTNCPANTTRAYLWDVDNQNWLSYTYRGSSVTPSDPWICQGDAFMIHNNSYEEFTITFAGVIPTEDVVSKPLQLGKINAVGYSFPLVLGWYRPIESIDTSSMYPSLGYPAVTNDKVYRMLPNGSWLIQTRRGTMWTGDSGEYTPELVLGEGCLIFVTNNQQPRTWIQHKWGSPPLN